MYFTIANKHAIYRTNDLATYEVYAGSALSSGDISGTGSAVRLSSPQTLDFFGSRLYFSDAGSRKLKYID